MELPVSPVIGLYNLRRPLRTVTSWVLIRSIHWGLWAVGKSDLAMDPARSQPAPDRGLPNSPDNLRGYLVLLTIWYGVASTAWQYSACMESLLKPIERL